jgi:hypothetical protein
VRRRPRSYYRVAGIDLRAELERLRSLPVFRGGALAQREPELRIRRARRQPNRLGFAIPDDWRLSVTSYPGIRPGDALETLLHELVHLHVGAEPGHRRWHGRAFNETLRRAMREAYGITGVRGRGALHGAYADSLERQRARRSSTAQLELPMAV